MDISSLKILLAGMVIATLSCSPTESEPTEQDLKEALEMPLPDDAGTAGGTGTGSGSGPGFSQAPTAESFRLAIYNSIAPAIKAIPQFSLEIDDGEEEGEGDEDEDDNDGMAVTSLDGSGTLITSIDDLVEIQLELPNYYLANASGFIAWVAKSFAYLFGIELCATPDRCVALPGVISGQLGSTPTVINLATVNSAFDEVFDQGDHQESDRNEREDPDPTHLKYWFANQTLIVELYYAVTAGFQRGAVYKLSLGGTRLNAEILYDREFVAPEESENLPKIFQLNLATSTEASASNISLRVDFNDLGTMPGPLYPTTASVLYHIGVPTGPTAQAPPTTPVQIVFSESEGATQPRHQVSALKNDLADATGISGSNVQVNEIQMGLTDPAPPAPEYVFSAAVSMARPAFTQEETNAIAPAEIGSPTLIVSAVTRDPTNNETYLQLGMYADGLGYSLDEIFEDGSLATTYINLFITALMGDRPGTECVDLSQILEYNNCANGSRPSYRTLRIDLTDKCSATEAAASTESCRRWLLLSQHKGTVLFADQGEVSVNRPAARFLNLTEVNDMDPITTLGDPITAVE